MLNYMKCPNCGATMQFDEASNTMNCQYCGTSIKNSTETENAGGTPVPIPEMPSDQGYREQPVHEPRPNRVRMQRSPLSAIAFFLTLTGFLAWAGVGLAVVDIFVLDKAKEKDHKLSYAAMVIGTLMIIYFIRLALRNRGLM